MRPFKPFDFVAHHGGIEKWPKLDHAEHAAYHAWREHAAHELVSAPSGLPNRATAEGVWDIVSPSLTPYALKRFLARARWGNHADITIRRALVVTLDLFSAYAAARRPISSLRLAEALAARWSPRYRMVRAATGCPTISGMTRVDAISILRELKCEGIAFWDFWRIALGASGWATKPLSLYVKGRLIPHRGYQLAPLRRESEIKAAFAELITADTGYHRPRAAQAVGLLLASEPMSRAPIRRRFAGNQPYNVVVSEERGQARLRQLEETVLWFDVVSFAFDYVLYRRTLTELKRHEQEAKERRRIASMQTQVKAARRQVHALDLGTLIEGRYIPIRVGYMRTINRRYHARSFGPEWVSGQDLPHGLGSPRERWFRMPRPGWATPPVGVEWDTDRLGTSYPLRGYDTSSSMTQLITWLIGATELEPLVFDPKKSFTTFLAELFWENRKRLLLRATYQGADEIRDMVKKVWVAHIYGGRLALAVGRDPRWITDPNAVPPSPPRRGASKTATAQYKNERAAFRRQHVRPVAKAVESFVQEQSWYTPLREFQEAMRALARAATDRDRFRGIVLTDPYDGATVRWDPVRVGTYRVSHDGGDLILHLPGYWGQSVDVGPQTLKRTAEFKHSERDPHGDGYLVDHDKLRRQAPPLIIHMLDACLSALVMEQFTQRPIKQITLDEKAAQFPPRAFAPDDGWQVNPGATMPIVALHDAWYVAGVGATEYRPLGEFSVETPIRIAVRAASREWDRRLGGVYDTLVHYLEGTKFEGWARDIRLKWLTRSDAPSFVISPTPKAT